jgi:hypothetical protein
MIIVVSLIVLLNASYWMVTTKGYVTNTYIHKINNNSNEYRFNFNYNFNRNKNYDNNYGISKNNYNNSDIELTVTIAAETSSTSTSEELVTDNVTSQEDANQIQRLKSMITLNSYIDNNYNNIQDYERQALHDLYLSTNGDKWLWHYDGGHWNFTNPYVNPCNDSYSYNLDNYFNNNTYSVEYTWQGLRCMYDEDLSYYYITSINLGRYSLQGKIPETIGNFNQLIILELQENMLSNTIPSTIGNLHEFRYMYNSLYHYHSTNVAYIFTISITISLTIFLIQYHEQ